MMKKLLSIALISAFMFGCNLTKKSSESKISLLGSVWEYSDSDWTYQIEFAENGILKTMHPNDNTPQNDFWKQTDNQIHFEFNDGFSVYDGTINSPKLIVGEGSSQSGKWKWQMTKIK